MEVVEEIKSNEWFHLIDHMYAKWPKINFPFLANVEENKRAPHLIPEVVRNPTHRRQNMKRKRGRKRKSIQKPTKKRVGAKGPSQKGSGGRKEGAKALGAASPPVQRRTSIIQTRAQKGGVGGSIRTVGLHFRQCPCCEGVTDRLLKPRILTKMVSEEAKDV